MAKPNRLPANISHKRVFSTEALNESLRLMAQKGLSKRFPVFDNNIICRLEFELYLTESDNCAEDILILCDIINELEHKNLLYELTTDGIETSLLMYCLFLTNKNPVELPLLECIMSEFKLQSFKIIVETKGLQIIDEYLQCKFGKRKLGKRTPEIQIFNPLR